MPQVTAQNILDDNGYTVVSGTTGDFTLAVVERQIDKAISHFNARTGRGTALMSGTTGAKTVDIPDEEYGVIDAIITCLLREAKKTSLSNASSTGGSSGSAKAVSIAGMSMSQSNSISSAISATSAINNSGNSVLIEWINDELIRLREIEVSYG